MKINVTARYTVWIDRDVEADNEEEALETVLGETRAALKQVDGVIEYDLGDCGTSAL